MSLGNGTTVSGLGATNDDAHNVDDKGNVQIDFVWGNFPLAPNDDRTDKPILNTASYGTNLDFTLDNHVIVETGWNGYPLYTPNTTGSAAAGSYVNGVEVPGAIYLQFPVILGDLTAVAVDNLNDAGYALANITTASGATNTAGNITRINATAAGVANVYATSADSLYPVGTQITIQAGTPAGSNPVNVPAAFLGSWYVTGNGSGYVTIAGSGFTVADNTGINATGTLKGRTGSIKAYTLGAGTTANQTTASTITITPWA